ncbi:MAG: phosphoglycerate mutase family protein [Acidobacteria bacterium]|nr:phosphoglycerate mutase family protein [Acidobacteriota bacterium]
MLHIVRHGRTDHNASGLLLGRIDPPLDDLGRAQAEAMAASFTHVDRVICSPLQRTRETAAAFGIEPIIDDRWIELDYGDYDGRPLGEIASETWQAWRTDLDFAPPGGESLRQLGDRVRQALDELIADGSAADRTTVIVTHVSPIKAATCWALGVDDLVAWRLWVATASITRIGTTPRGGVLHGFNEVAHLRDLPG